MRVFVCRRDMQAAKTAALRVAQCGHSVVAITTPRKMDIDAMQNCAADVYLIDRYMPHPDGDFLQKALHPRRCILIGTDIGKAVSELETAAQSCIPEAVQRMIWEELLQMGFRIHTRGARQMYAALCLVMRDDRVLMDLKQCVYPKVAEKHGCTWQSVERNLRYAIEGVWTHGDLQALQERFGDTVEAERGKPTNKAFLAQMAEYIRLKRA